MQSVVRMKEQTPTIDSNRALGNSRGGRSPARSFDWFESESRLGLHPPMNYREFSAPQQSHQYDQSGQADLSIFRPDIDVTESNGSYYVCCEVPGLMSTDLEVEVVDDMLVISGEKTTRTRTDTDLSHRVETRIGKFQRRLSIPSDANTESISATCENGLLDIELPKLEESSLNRRTIDIS